MQRLPWLVVIFFCVSCVKSQTSQKQSVKPTPPSSHWLGDYNFVPENVTPVLTRWLKNRIRILESSQGTTLGVAQAWQENFQKKMTLSESFLVGTHNSYNSTAYGVKIGAEQTLTITQQLDLGVRFLMLDTLDCDGVLYMAHKFCPLKGETLSKTVDEIAEWHSKHPDTFLAIDIENNHDPKYNDMMIQIFLDKLEKKILYPQSRREFFQSVNYVPGKIMLLLERFSKADPENDLLLDYFHKYTLAKDEIDDTEDRKSYIFIPRYPQNLVNEFRNHPPVQQEIRWRKLQGYLWMYEGTNLSLGSIANSLTGGLIGPGKYEVTPVDLMMMMYTGINIVSLHELKSNDTQIQAASLWTLEPGAEPNSACYAINHETGLLRNSLCDQELAACLTGDIWTVSKSKSGSKHCEEGEFVPPRSPTDALVIMMTAETLYPGKDVLVAITGDQD